MQAKGELRDYVLTVNNEVIVQIKTGVNNEIADELEKLKNAPNGIRIELKPWREQRSLDANSYFHVLVHKLAEKLNIGNDECKIKMNLEYGTPATDDNGNKVYVKLPASVNVQDFYDYAKWVADKIENGLKLSYYVFYKQTHLLDTKEMSRLIDGVIEECHQVGIDTKTPQQVTELLNAWEAYHG